jgi:long-subunit fatty acid transport protein
MKHVAAASAALLASASVALAGGIERDRGSMAILFEEGTYAELGFTFVDPDVSGSATAGYGGDPSGDMLSSYTYANLSFRSDLTENLSYAIIWSQPFGADVSYPTGTGYPLAGTTASVEAQQLGVVLRYAFEGGFSAYAGLRAVEATGSAAIPGVGYSLSVDGSTELGYLVGVAYERPDIALRVSLTYQSATDHTFTGTENGVATLPFETTLPQSLTLEAQSGIAPNTLLFGSIRWVDWSEFSINPIGYSLARGEPLAQNSQDVMTYRLGIARRFSDSFVGLASVTYEPNGVGSFSGNSFQGNLDPRDGRLGIGIGGRYEFDSGLSISGGVEYLMFNDATTAFPGVPNVPFGVFTDNDGYAAAIRIGYRF